MKFKTVPQNLVQIFHAKFNRFRSGISGIVNWRLTHEHEINTWFSNNFPKYNYK
jgi:hypothetical protein